MLAHVISFQSSSVYYIYVITGAKVLINRQTYQLDTYIVHAYMQTLFMCCMAIGSSH